VQSDMIKTNANAYPLPLAWWSVFTGEVVGSEDGPNRSRNPPAVCAFSLL